jgi:hypothetical protein
MQRKSRTYSNANHKQPSDRSVWRVSTKLRWFLLAVARCRSRSPVGVMKIGSHLRDSITGRVGLRPVRPQFSQNFPPNLKSLVCVHPPQKVSAAKKSCACSKVCWRAHDRQMVVDVARIRVASYICDANEQKFWKRLDTTVGKNGTIRGKPSAPKRQGA